MLLALLRCNSYREEFNRVASVVDAKFTIRKMYLGYYNSVSSHYQDVGGTSGNTRH